jgi:hypothetical protein
MVYLASREGAGGREKKLSLAAVARAKDYPLGAALLRSLALVLYIMVSIAGRAFWL